jgi:thymidine kinase
MTRRVADKRTGSITLITGSMFAGKTEELIRLVRRAMHARRRVQVFKSALETRAETALIRTHDGIVFSATAVRDTAEMEALIEPETDLVAIEEVQFFDEPVVDLCCRLADRGVTVIAAGLDQDFRGVPFGFMPRLLALAEDVYKLHAICKKCGADASRTQRLIDGRPASYHDPIILIGAEESYEARCRACHEVKNRPGDSEPRPRRPRSPAKPPPPPPHMGSLFE